MMLHRASRFTLALMLLGVPAVASAQAFGLNEIGSCAIARGFAATAVPCDDGSSIYWNPGALPSNRGYTVLAGVTSIAVSGNFLQDTTRTTYDPDLPVSYVPHLFINYRGAGKLAYGVGMYVPYGLTSQWRDDFPGRFAALKASLQTIYVQPNIAYQLNDNWSVGGGPVIGHSSIELIQGIDLSQQIANPAAGITFGQLGIPKRTEFARATLKGSSMAYGADFGVHGQLNPVWQMGLRFLTQVTFSYDDADATFEQRPTGLILAANNPLGAPAGTPVDALLAGQFTGTGKLQAQKVATHIQHPAQVQVGFAYTGYQNTTLSLEYAYVGWKSFRELPVDFTAADTARTATDKVLREDYNNTSTFRFGAEHRLMNGIALRAGVSAGTAAAPDETVTPLLPEQDRSTASFGAGLPIGKRFTLDASYAHVFTPGRRGRLDERPDGSTTAQAIALNNGSYALSANIFSVSLKALY
jgi:long-chain fatty acid transport protein